MTTRRLITSTLLAVALAGGFVRGSDGPKTDVHPGFRRADFVRDSSPDRKIPGR